MSDQPLTLPGYPSRTGYPPGMRAFRTPSMVLRQVKPASDARADPTPMRWAIIGITIAFLTLFVVIPLVNVFAQAFSKGLEAYVAAIGNPDALAAIKLTLIVAAISVGLNLVFGIVAAWAITKYEFRRQELADHGDRPAVLRLSGDRRTGVRALVRRAGLSRALAAGARHHTSYSRFPASCWRPSS